MRRGQEAEGSAREAKQVPLEEEGAMLGAGSRAPSSTHAHRASRPGSHTNCAISFRANFNYGQKILQVKQTSPKKDAKHDYKYFLQILLTVSKSEN